jgi:hypothetical protein
MAISDFFGNAPLWSFIKDQNIREILTKREFRISEEYLHRDFVSRAADEKVRNLSLKIYDGYAEITGRVQQRPLPGFVPFLARFALHGYEFDRNSRKLHLKVKEVKPMGGDLLIGKLAKKIPFLSCEKGVAVCDLMKMPLLCDLFGYHVKGMPVMDFVTLKELRLNEGEIVGKLGVRL